MLRTIWQNKSAQDWLLGILALALFVMPWIAGTGDHAASWSAWLGAILLAYLAAASLFEASLFQISQWEEWVTTALGLWLVFAPHLLGFGTDFLIAWAHRVIGLMTIAVSLWAEWSFRHPFDWQSSPLKVEHAHASPFAVFASQQPEATC